MNLICYAHYRDAVEHVFRLIAQLRKQLQITEVLVVHDRTNLAALVPPRQVGAVCLLPYDGKDWEFGAYQLGLDHVDREGVEGVVVLNDTAGRNYPLFGSHLRKLGQICAESAASDRAVLAGKLESQRQAFAIQGLAFDSWIRSNLFFVNRAGLETLAWRLFDPAVFTAPACRDGIVATSGIASAALQTYIANWLGVGAGPQGWRAHTDRTAVSDSLLARKAGSILLEKYLSAKVIAAGGQLVDYDETKSSMLWELKQRSFYLRRRFSRALKRRPGALNRRLAR